MEWVKKQTPIETFYTFSLEQSFDPAVIIAKHRIDPGSVRCMTND
jgi:hypothetical protein